MVNSTNKGNVEGFATANPGDRIASEPQTIEEKGKQIAVDKHDMTGEHIQVPTYFVVKYPNGETKALHHVRDAQAISDAIRQMNFEDEPVTKQERSNRAHPNGLLPILGLSLVVLLLLTTLLTMGVF